METKIITIVAMTMLVPVSQVQAIDIDFYHDATIEDSDVYGIVRVYDTQPDTTTVDMYGGSIGELRPYDTSTVNINGGEVHWSITTYNSSIVNIYGGSVTCHSLAVMDLSTLNIYGGNFYSGNAPYFSELSTVNIYGYDFNYDGWSLTGFLQDGSPFIFNELAFDKYSHMNLIPEQATVLLFAFAGLLIRKRR